MHEADRPRGFWKLARVEDLITGADGLVRWACIQTHSAGNRTAHLRRPVQLLYPLEVHSSADSVDRDSDARTPDVSSVPETVHSSADSVDRDSDARTPDVSSVPETVHSSADSVDRDSDARTPDVSSVQETEQRATDSGSEEVQVVRSRRSTRVPARNAEEDSEL